MSLTWLWIVGWDKPSSFARCEIVFGCRAIALRTRSFVPSGKSLNCVTPAQGSLYPLSLDTHSQGNRSGHSFLRTLMELAPADFDQVDNSGQT